MKSRFLLPLLLVAACSVAGEPVEPEPTIGGEVAIGTPPPAPAPAPPPAPACEPLSPRTTPLEVFVQPEAGATPFVDTIGRAKTSLRVMVYQMGSGPVLEAIEAKAKAGVATRVILDLAQEDVNAKYKTRLEAAGAEVIWSDPAFTFMHAKVIIADESEAVISTGNYYIRNILSERNFAVRDADAQDIEVLTKLFDSDWERKSPDVSCTRLLVSPVNAKERLLAFIASAKKTITVESMQMGDKDVRNALAERRAAGVDVKVVLADPNWIDANAGAATFLQTNQIPARWIKHMHAKAIVVDGATAFAGSINFSWTSLTKNREVGVLLSEMTNVSQMTETFEKDWSAATPF